MSERVAVDGVVGDEDLVASFLAGLSPGQVVRLGSWVWTWRPIGAQVAQTVGVPVEAGERRLSWAYASPMRLVLSRRP